MFVFVGVYRGGRGGHVCVCVCGGGAIAYSGGRVGHLCVCEGG